MTCNDVTALTLRGPLLVTFFNGRFSSNTEGCTIDNATGWVVYAWKSSCSFLQWSKTVLEVNLDRWIRRGFVASSIARPHTWQLLPVEPSEGLGLLGESQCAGLALAFHARGCHNDATQFWNFSWLYWARLWFQSNREHFSNDCKIL
jgi:hypothetical protein